MLTYFRLEIASARSHCPYSGVLCGQHPEAAPTPATTACSHGASSIRSSPPSGRRLQPVWNRYCIVTLRKLLPSLEKASWSNEQTSTILQDHLLELNHILSSHKMCGFPLNFAYTKIEDIEEAVKGTGVHCYESLDVEFALAVYVHPYPCDILSVWVYVASLVRRR
ncbi:hypothetical protein LSTR_LSTR011823 [Laodelphax striatellus]|uniref:Centrosomal protein of 76 kDa C-terminal domain-containing protein n=1 Tax=Laodelphax striatellus TaxID=195883 RepID=A0A482WHZ1_LAOST|nr:hypothetical protein LSTR_LSTR011823 [Laodelphax striatellus]